MLHNYQIHPFQHSRTASHIPEQKELDQLGDIHNQLESRYAPLLATFTSLCDDVKRIAEEIDYAPEGVKEIDLFTHRLGLERLGKLGLAKLTPGRVRKVTLLVSPDSNDNSVLNQQQQPDSTSDSGTGGDTNEPIIDDDVIKCLSDLRLKLIKQKARLAATGDELRDYLKRMWTRLGRSPEEQVKGVDLMSSGGFKPSVIEALQEEVDKCQQQKWENVDQYLTNLLTEVSELAGKCCITYNSTEYETLSSKIGQNDRETTVNNLETKADQLADAYLNHKAIYDSLATYRDACTNLNQIDARLRDPAILSNRGGILLKTEKERKVRFKELQRLEAETVDSVKQYQNKTNQTFQLIDGTLVEEFIKSLNYDLKVSRDNSRVRKPSRPLSGNTTVAQQSNGTPS